jgi:long-chain acyl-CoA synthetase
MKGYWNNPQATAETIRDGWLHTGDLGSLDAEGFLTITGRKKELMVLSNGKKTVPSYLEGLLLADPCIDQAAIYGEGKNFLTAVIVPQWEQVRKALGVQGDEETLAGDPGVLTLLQQRIAAALQDVSTCEQIKKFIVRARPFSVASDELTVSLKLRRKVVFERHRAELEALYRE